MANKPGDAPENAPPGRDEPGGRGRPILLRRRVEFGEETVGLLEAAIGGDDRDVDARDEDRAVLRAELPVEQRAVVMDRVVFPGGRGNRGGGARDAIGAGLATGSGVFVTAF
ncbi:MAG: hypothetical protein JSR61_01535 [Proteobacteria bacterium]|nr:hypothetical protein [Pseudomonadota bacterium]